MAKRSTIGENPLDFLVSENSLDTVVPGPEAASRATKLDERLDRFEAGIGALQAEVAGVKNLMPESHRAQAETAQLQGELARMKGELERLTATIPPLQAELAPLKTKVAALQAEVAQLRARMTPSDIPWWMGKKK
jgi:chromosome segregation ATPase